MVFDTLIDVLKYKPTPTKDAAIQQKSLDGTIVKIGKNVKLSYQNALRLPSYRGKTSDGELPSVTPIVSSPLRRRKGDTSPDHIIVDGADGLELITESSATPRKGRKLKVRRTIQSAIEEDDGFPTIHRKSDAVAVSAGSIGNWPQSAPPTGRSYSSDNKIGPPPNSWDGVVYIHTKLYDSRKANSSSS